VLVTPREEEPQINVTMANVLIPFPGASSADVQNMVARPAEQVLSQIAGIEHTYSVARPGMAVLTVQFKVGVPRTEALVRLYDVLNANQDWLPRNLGTLAPIVKPKGIDDVPVLAVTLWSKDAPSALELERVAHTMEAELKRVPGTARSSHHRRPRPGAEVALHPSACASAVSTCCACSRRWQAANLAMPAGSVVDAAGAACWPWRPANSCARRRRRRARGRRARRQAGLPARGGRRSRRLRRSRSAMSGSHRAVQGGGAYPAVTVTVTKKPGQNAVDVARAARARVDELRNTVIPPGMRPRQPRLRRRPRPRRPTS
jgi:multidrug efflux pump subunit AcrB